jgi:hypothetical protein
VWYGRICNLWEIVCDMAGSVICVIRKQALVSFLLNKNNLQCITRWLKHSTTGILVLIYRFRNSIAMWVNCLCDIHDQPSPLVFIANTCINIFLVNNNIMFILFSRKKEDKKNSATSYNNNAYIGNGWSPCHILFPTNYRSCHITYYFPQITDPAISHKYYFLPYHILFTIITLLILHIGKIVLRPITIMYISEMADHGCHINNLPTIQ